MQAHSKKDKEKCFHSTLTNTDLLPELDGIIMSVKRAVEEKVWQNLILLD